MTSTLVLLVVACLAVVLHDANCDPNPGLGFKLPFGIPGGAVRIAHFRMENCGGDSDPARLENVTVASNKGDITVGGSVVVNEPLESPIKAKVVILAKPDHVPRPSRKPITVECKNGIGSCEYDDLCDFGIAAEGECPAITQQLGFPCRCPIEPGTYTMKNQTFPLGQYGSLVTGVYGLSVNISHNDQVVSCYKISFALI